MLELENLPVVELEKTLKAINKTIIIHNGKIIEQTNDIFTAERCNFQQEPGYMVSQIHDRRKAAGQYVSESIINYFVKN